MLIVDDCLLMMMISIKKYLHREVTDFVVAICEGKCQSIEIS